MLSRERVMRITIDVPNAVLEERNTIITTASNWAEKMVAEWRGTKSEWLGHLVGSLLAEHEVDDLNAGIKERVE